MLVSPMQNEQYSICYGDIGPCAQNCSKFDIEHNRKDPRDRLKKEDNHHFDRLYWHQVISNFEI